MRNGKTDKKIRKKKNGKSKTVRGQVGCGRHLLFSGGIGLPAVIPDTGRGGYG